MNRRGAEDAEEGGAVGSFRRSAREGAVEARQREGDREGAATGHTKEGGVATKNGHEWTEGVLRAATVRENFLFEMQLSYRQAVADLPIVKTVPEACPLCARNVTGS